MPAASRSDVSCRHTTAHAHHVRSVRASGGPSRSALKPDTTDVALHSARGHPAERSTSPDHPDGAGRHRRHGDGGPGAPKRRGCGGGALLAAVARAVRDRRLEVRRPRRPNGARRRTSAGRSRFPAADRRRRSIWGDRMFVLSAVPIGVDGAASHAPRGGVQPRDRYRFVVLAIDRRTGKTVWERTAREEQPHEATHGENGTYASSSAITDGQRVYAWFESQGMYVYDMDGTLLWSKDLGDKTMRNQFGEGSTPVLAGDRLVIVWDHLGGSFIVVARRGERTRAVARRAATRSTPGRRRWSSSRAAARQAIVPGKNKIRSYDLETGEIVWESKGVTMNPIPSPVFGDGMVFVTSGFQGNNLKAIRLGEREGRHHRHRRDRLDARSRHAVRAVAAAVRRHPLPAQDELGDPFGVRRARRASRTTSCSDSRGCRRCSRRRSAPTAASTSPAATA